MHPHRNQTPGFILGIALSLLVLFLPSTVAAKRLPRVTGLQITEVGDRYIALQWQEEETADLYQLRMFNKRRRKLRAVHFETPTALIENLKPKRRYFFRVRAVNDAKKGRWSKKLKARTTVSADQDPQAPPHNLALPFRLEDLFSTESSFICAFGVVRKSADRPEFGHSGIDVPLPYGAAIYAAANGTILSADVAGDGRPGSNVKLLIKDGGAQGEGWVFFIEHVTLESGLAVGDQVTKGEIIARNAIVSSSNNHMQLTYAFNGYEFSRDHTCWVQQLETADSAALFDRFNNDIRISGLFVNGWNTAVDEGFLPYQGLLDSMQFPEGAQLCYPPGTDVRVPAL